MKQFHSFVVSAGVQLFGTLQIKEHSDSQTQETMQTMGMSQALYQPKALNVNTRVP